MVLEMLSGAEASKLLNLKTELQANESTSALPWLRMTCLSSS